MSVINGIEIFEKATEFIKKYKFKKDRILLIVEQDRTKLEKRLFYFNFLTNFTRDLDPNYFME